jgi:hypothetical protein
MPAPTRTRRGGDTATGPGRFSRGHATPSRRPSVSPGLRRRKPPEQGKLKKAMSAVMPAGAAAKKAAPSSKKGKAGGFAIAAAAAAAAFKNREKLAGMVRKGDSSSSDTEQPGEAVNNATPPSTPTV